MKNGIIIILAILLLAGVIYETTREKLPQVTLTTTTVVKGDTVTLWNTTPIQKPDTVWNDEAEIITLPADSLCIEQWLELRTQLGQTKVYNNIIKDDSSAFIQINDTRKGNQLIGRGFGFANRRLTAINTTIITPKPEQKGWAIGGFIGINTATVAVLRENGRFIYGIGYEIKTKSPTIGCFIRF